jgi:hypothetical protein
MLINSKYRTDKVKVPLQFGIRGTVWAYLKKQCNLTMNWVRSENSLSMAVVQSH